MLVVPHSNFGEIRSVVEQDLDMVRAWRNAPEVRSRMYMQHEISPEEHRRWWESKRHSDRDILLIYSFAERPAGFIALSEINRVWKTASWAFYAAPGAPKGTGSLMELLVLDMFFIEMGMRKLCCEVLSSNQAVLTLHHKHGFVQEGLRRRHVWTVNGFEDVHLLAIFADDWVNARPRMLERLAAFTTS